MFCHSIALLAFTICSAATASFVKYGSKLKSSRDLQIPDLMKVVVQHDNFPTDTAWKIYDAISGDILVEKDSGAIGRNDEKTWEVPLEPGGDYCFQITDQFSDGICCSQGQGSYQLVAPNDNEFIRSDNIDGGNFGKASKELCFHVNSDGSVERGKSRK
jgi:hypothetical protein